MFRTYTLYTARVVIRHASPGHAAHIPVCQYCILMCMVLLAQQSMC